MKIEYVYIGVGVTAFIVVGAVAILMNRSKSKVDLSKFDSPDMPGSGKCMDKSFIKMLLKVQKETKLPIFQWINSGARSAYWNSKVGGVGSSAHKIPKCKAADIKTPTKEIRDRIIKAAKKACFRRMGIGDLVSKNTNW